MSPPAGVRRRSRPHRELRSAPPARARSKASVSTCRSLQESDCGPSIRVRAGDRNPLNRDLTLGGGRLLRLVPLLPRRRDELHLEALDPRALDLEHAKVQAVVVDLVALIGRPAEQPE